MIRKKDRRNEEAPAEKSRDEARAGNPHEEAAAETMPGPAVGERAEESASSAAATSPDEAARLVAELERARAREDELMRAVAELTNVNRRRKQEAEAIVDLAQESLVRSILPVLDDIDRALQASKDREGDPVRAGVELIRERLWRTLEREGLREIPALGARFDPELHDAVAQRASGGEAPDTVVEVLLPGYKFRNRILRHAQVIVAAPAHAGSAAMPSHAAPGAEEIEP